MIRENLDEIFAEISAGHARFVVTRRNLRALRVPFLSLVGAADHPSIRWSSRQLAGAVLGGRFGYIPGADHLPNLSAPAAFDSAVFGFLR
jgi:pimeloyl-ACP methyl ester carboxylesterase